MRRPSGDWILCDLQIDSIEGGYGHGHMHMFDETGALVATASQSMLVRQRREDGRTGLRPAG
jgi:acyl-CoA thioesterase